MVEEALGRNCQKGEERGQYEVSDGPPFVLGNEQPSQVDPEVPRPVHVNQEVGVLLDGLSGQDGWRLGGGASTEAVIFDSGVAATRDISKTSEATKILGLSSSA